MSRQECMEGINEMLKKVSTKNLERLYYFISGCAAALAFQEERRSKQHE